MTGRPAGPTKSLATLWPMRGRELTPTDVPAPLGLALVSSCLKLVVEKEAAMIAEDGTGAWYHYGQRGFPGASRSGPCGRASGKRCYRRTSGGSQG